MAYTGSYDSDDLPNIFIDLVGRIGVAITSRADLLVGGILLVAIVGLYLGLPQKVFKWMGEFLHGKGGLAVK